MGKDLKEVKFSPNTGEHDIAFKSRAIGKFLAKGIPVRISVTLRGREQAHADLGQALLERLVDEHAGVAFQGYPVRLRGNQMDTTLIPRSK